MKRRMALVIPILLALNYLNIEFAKAAVGDSTSVVLSLVSGNTSTVNVGDTATNVLKIDGTGVGTPNNGIITVSEPTVATGSASVISSSTTGATASTTAQFNIADGASRTNVTSSIYAPLPAGPTYRITVIPGGAASAISVQNTVTIVPDKAGKYEITFTPTSGLLKAGGGAANPITWTIYANAPVSKTSTTTVTGTQGVAGVGLTSGITGVVGNYISVTYTAKINDSSYNYYNVTATGASITTARVSTTEVATQADNSTNAITTSAAVSPLNGSVSDWSAGARITGPKADNYDNNTLTDTDAVITVTLTSATAGSGTITVSGINSTTGVGTTVATLAMSWVAAASTVVSTTNSTAAIIKPVVAAGPAYTANCSAAATNSSLAAAGLTRSTMATAGTTNALSYAGTASTTDKGMVLCFVPRDGNGTAITSLAHIYVSTTIGSFASGSVVRFADIATSSTTAAGNLELDSSASTYLGSDIAGTVTLRIFGDGVAKGAGTVTITAVDATGNSAVFTLPVTFYGGLDSIALVQGQYAGDINNSTAAYATSGIDTVNATANQVVAAYISGKDSAGNAIDLYRTGEATVGNLTVDSTYNAVAQTTRGAIDSAATMTVGVPDSLNAYQAIAANCYANGKAEKLTISIWAVKTATGAYIQSNPVTFYCSDAPKTVAVTVTGSSVNVDVKDANGYPVPDGTSVSLAASNGAVVAPSSKSTANGKFTTAATFVPTASAASATVTAIAGSVSGVSAAVAGTGTQAATDAAIASLIAKINALSKLIAKIQKKLGVK